MRSNTAPPNLIKLQVYPLEIKKNIYFFKKRHLFYSDRGKDKRKNQSVLLITSLSSLSLPAFQMTMLAWLNNKIISILQS